MLGSVAEQDWWMVSGQDALANASWQQTMQCMKCMALHCIALHCNAMHFMHCMVCGQDALANAPWPHTINGARIYSLLVNGMLRPP